MVGDTPYLLGPIIFRIALKLHKRENFLASDFEYSTFSYLCINSKVLQKKCFDWALIGEDTIVLRTLSIRRTKDFQQAR